MSLKVIDSIIQSGCCRMSTSPRLLRLVEVTNILPRSSNVTPIGSATIDSGAHRLSSSPGATSALTAARPSFDQRTAGSGLSRTTLGLNAGTLSTTSARAGRDAAVGAGAGAGAGAAWHAASAASRKDGRRMRHEAHHGALVNTMMCHSFDVETRSGYRPGMVDRSLAAVRGRVESAMSHYEIYAVFVDVPRSARPPRTGLSSQGAPHWCPAAVPPFPPRTRTTAPRAARAPPRT